MADSGLERILVVDDDPILLEITQALLESALDGAEVRACGSGEEAVAVAPGFEPQLVLLDLRMPGMDGLETLAALRRVPGLARTAVVLLTAGTAEIDVEDARRRGAAAVLSKPFDPSTLADQLQEIFSDPDRTA